MTDDEGIGPIVPPRQRGTEASGAIDNGVFGFFFRGPPDFVDAREIVGGPIALQDGAGRADIARKREPLPHDRVDGDRQAKRRGDGTGGLQGARVGGDDDALDAKPHKLSGGSPRLGVAQVGQARIDDAGIAASDAEM